MKAWLMALVLGRRRELIKLPPFLASATVPIPQGVSRLESIVGKGAAGSPGTPGTPGRNGYTVTTNTAYRRRDGKPDDIILGSPSSPIPGPVPADYCEETAIPISESVVYYSMFRCYNYDYKFVPGTEIPPTTGASATGFGQTFVGGTGGPATAREVKNVAVTPGGSYQVVVPSGGSIAISYYL